MTRRTLRLAPRRPRGRGRRVGVAGADNSGGFVDPVGDAGSSVDITRVEIESYDAGWLSFTIRVNGFFTCSSDGDGEPALVALDLDQNPDTGSAFYGTEVELAPDAIGDAHLYRAHDWDFRGVPGSSGLGGGCGQGVGYYSVDTSQARAQARRGFQRRRRVTRPQGRHGSRSPHLQLPASAGNSAAGARARSPRSAPDRVRVCGSSRQAGGRARIAGARSKAAARLAMVAHGEEDVRLLGDPAPLAGFQSLERCSRRRR